MKRILARILLAHCPFLLTACLQGLEDHSRFDFKPPILGQAIAGNLDAVRTYIGSGGDVNVCDSEGNTMLMLSVVGDNSELVAYLLAKGADPKRRNKVGETALEIAKRGSAKRVTKLLEAALPMSMRKN